MGFAILAAGCSLIFESADADPAAQVCKGIQRTYPRGAREIPGAYEHLNYHQGTVTFWIEPLELSEDDSTLILDLAGIQVEALFPDGLRFSISGIAPFEVESPPWRTGENTFVSFRWDRTRPLSGAGEFNIEIRVNETKTLRDGVFAVAIPANDVIVVGPDDGSFHVDQLVVYDRPLYVPDSIQEPSTLSRMAQQKGAGPLLDDAGFDVIFATASPADPGCSNYEAEGWRAPPPTLNGRRVNQGQIQGWSEDLDPAVEPIFTAGGFALIEGQSIRQTIDVAQGGSYVLEVLTHTRGAGATEVKVFESGAQGPFAFIAGNGGSRDHPERLLLTFQTSPTTLEIELELGTTVGDTDVHSIALHQNLLVDSGFETGDLGDAWQRDSTGNPSLEFLMVEPYASQVSVCVLAEELPEVLIQEPAQGGLQRDGIYLFGGAFRWRDGEPPGIAIGNGSLFATGTPIASETKAGFSVGDFDRWAPAAGVGRHRQDSLHNNHNAQLRFGSNRYGSDASASFCLDSAFQVEALRIR